MNEKIESLQEINKKYKDKLKEYLELKKCNK